MDDKIPKPDMDSVNCDNTQCSRFGEYIECYFDFEQCMHHRAYMQKLARGELEDWGLYDG